MSDPSPPTNFAFCVVLLLLVMETRIHKGMEDDGRAVLDRARELATELEELTGALSLDARVDEIAALSEVRQFLQRKAPVLSRLV